MASNLLEMASNLIVMASNLEAMASNLDDFDSSNRKDFKEEGVMVHPSVYPDIIGKGGVTIKASFVSPTSAIEGFEGGEVVEGSFHFCKKHSRI